MSSGEKTVEQLLDLSDTAEESGDAQQQEHYIRQAMELAESQGDQAGLADAWRYLSFMYLYRGESLEAIEAQQQSLRISEAADYSLGVSRALVNLGLIFSEVGMMPQAVEHLKRGIVFQEQHGHLRELRASLNNLAIVEESLGNLEEAERLYNRLFQIAKENDDEIDQMYYYINMVDILVERGEYDVAKANLQRALAINDDELSTELAYIYQFLGDIAMDLGNPEEASDYFARAVRVANQVGDPSARTAALLSKAQYHFDSEEYEPARQLAEETLQIALNSDLNTYTFESHKLLSDIAQALGQHQAALEHYKQYIEYRDRVFSDENARELQRQSMQAEFDKREALTQAELQRKSMQRNFSVAGLLFALFFTLVVLAQRNRIRIERDRSENLLLNILPYETAQELKKKGHADAQVIQQVSVLFTDFSGFTKLSETMAPSELVAAIHECFSAFDKIMEKHGVEKIKTIGDAYMAAGGLPTTNTTNAQDAVRAALDIQAYMQQHAIEKEAAGQPYFQIRIGVHTGPVVAGIVGIKKFQYDIWGDTVNTASRMESSGEIGRVNISETTQRLVANDFDFEFRGEIEAKGKGKIAMYFVNQTASLPVENPNN